MRSFMLQTLRSEKINAMIRFDPTGLKGWNNVVDVVRYVVGHVMQARDNYWTDYVLIPEERGSNGVWSVSDLHGRTTVVKDLEFLQCQ